MAITNSLIHNEVNPACPAFPSSPLEPVYRHILQVGIEIFYYTRSARTYRMSLNSLTFKIDFSFSGLTIIFIQLLQKK